MKPIYEYEDKEFVSAAMLLTMLGISRKTLHEWVKKEIVPAPVRFGQRRYWDKSCFNNFFLSHKDKEKAVDD